MLNTLRYANALKNAGVGAQQAEAMAEALDTEMTGELASKADIREVKADIRELATSTKAHIERLDTKIDHLDEKLTGQINALDEKLTGQINTLDERLTGQINALDEKLTPRIDGLDKRIDDLKVTTGVIIALATLVLTAVQVYFGLR